MNNIPSKDNMEEVTLIGTYQICYLKVNHFIIIFIQKIQLVIMYIMIQFTFLKISNIHLLKMFHKL